MPPGVPSPRLGGGTVCARSVAPLIVLARVRVPEVGAVTRAGEGGRGGERGGERRKLERWGENDLTVEIGVCSRRSWCDGFGLIDNT